MKHYFVVFSSFFFFFCTLTDCRLPYHGEVQAKGAILINADTGAVLLEKNPHTPLYPSSTTKVFTALYALEKKGVCLDEMVTASYDAVSYVTPAVRRAEDSKHPPYRLEFGGTHMNLKAGEILPFRTLIYGLMLCSGNDASNVIAQYVSGSIPKFLEELNQFAAKKGCLNTQLFTPHGLPHLVHKTTAYDLAVFTAEALKNPFFCEVVKSVGAVRPQTNLQPESTISQHNALLRAGKYYYPKAFGVKLGYTTSGGWSLVSAAENGQRRLISVLMGCETKDQLYRNAIALFEAAFNETKTSRTLFSKGFDLFTSQIEGGKNSLQAYLGNDVSISYYPSEEPTFRSQVEWQDLSLPIRTGQKVGEVHILTEKGRCLTTAELFAVRDVEATLYHRVHVVTTLVKKRISQYASLLLALVGTLFLLVTYLYSHRKKKAA